MLVSGRPRERGRREASLDSREGSSDTGFVKMLVWRFFTALLKKLGWGMGQRWAWSANGSSPAYRSLPSQLQSLSHDSFQAGCSFRRRRCRCRTVSLLYLPVPLPVLISPTGNRTSLLLEKNACGPSHKTLLVFCHI